MCGGGGSGDDDGVGGGGVGVSAPNGPSILLAYSGACWCGRRCGRYCLCLRCVRRSVADSGVPQEDESMLTIAVTALDVDIALLLLQAGAAVDLPVTVGPWVGTS